MSRRYAIILADPPWDIAQQGRRGASQHYELLNIDAICAIAVGRLAADQAHLWLWTTNAALFTARRVIDAWGFSYRSVLTWVKPRMGLGQYLRTATEHLLFAVRVRAPIRFRAQPSWLFAPVQEHSHKPEEQYAIIERCSPRPRLELFARRRRPGWDAWGDEIESDVEL